MTQLLTNWLKQNIAGASAIYILGDLFDYWIGPPCLMRFRNLFVCLSAISRTCPIYFMSGNRDFLLSQPLLTPFGITKIPDPFIIQYHGQKILLTHGDRLCTRDTAYQWLRFLLQNPITITLASFLPNSLCEKIARYLRRTSQHHTRRKQPLVMLADLVATTALADSHRASALIYGHVHRLEQYQLKNALCPDVYVLDSWEHQINYCRISANGVTLANDTIG